MITNPFLELLPSEPPETNPSYLWATVTQVNPLRIRFDGSDTAQETLPTDLVGGLGVGTRVYAQVKNNRVMIMGQAKPGSSEVKDWNNAITPGQYWSKAAANGPVAGGWFMGTVFVHQGENRIGQELRPANGVTYKNEVWRRYWNGASWTTWFLSGSSKELWTGAWYMAAGQSAVLSELVTDQENGIILVWQGYANGAAQGYDIIYTHVPKWQAETLAGKGVQSIIWPGTSGTAPFMKYLYIHNNRVDGNTINNQAPRNSHVLTAVLGY